MSEVALWDLMHRPFCRKAHRAVGVVLLQGPKEVMSFMSEVPLQDLMHRPLGRTLGQRTCDCRGTLLIRNTHLP